MPDIINNVVINARNTLSEHQTKKGTFFFNVNLDIERKGFVQKEDVEFYLLFHMTTVGKEDDEKLLKELSTLTENVWNYVLDCYPHEDKSRMTLDQFLDAWGTWSNILKKGESLPECVLSWIRAGYDLYRDSETDQEMLTLDSFLSLYQRMGLNLNSGIHAFKILRQRFGKPELNFDTVLGIIKLLLTTEEPSDLSGFILPGFDVPLATRTKDERKEPSDEAKAKATEATSKKSSDPKVVIEEIKQRPSGIVNGKDLGKVEEGNEKRREIPIENKVHDVPSSPPSAFPRNYHRADNNYRMPPRIPVAHFPSPSSFGPAPVPIMRLNNSHENPLQGPKIVPGLSENDKMYILGVLHKMNIDPKDCEIVLDPGTAPPQQFSDRPISKQFTSFAQTQTSNMAPPPPPTVQRRRNHTISSTDYQYDCCPTPFAPNVPQRNQPNYNQRPRFVPPSNIRPSPHPSQGVRSFSTSSRFGMRPPMANPPARLESANNALIDDVLRRIRPFVANMVKQELENYKITCGERNQAKSDSLRSSHTDFPRSGNPQTHGAHDEQSSFWSGLSGQDPSVNRMVFENLIRRQHQQKQKSESDASKRAEANDSASNSDEDDDGTSSADNEYVFLNQRIPAFDGNQTLFGGPLLMTMGPQFAADGQPPNAGEGLVVIMEDE